MRINFPFCYHPTTVVSLDDDLDLLKMLGMLLGVGGDNRIKFFYRPAEAMEFLEENARLPLSERLSFVDENVFDKTNVKIKVEMLHEMIYDENRINEISTLIVDYYMPNMDGLTFCRHFDHTEYRKIMLTGEADEALAVSAFNTGTIQRFVMKSELNLFDKILTLVKNMRWDYFVSITDFFVEALLGIDMVLFSYLLDAEFMTWLQAFLDEHHIREFYIFNALGDFLLIDQENKIWWMNVKTSRALNDLIAEAKNQYLEYPDPEAETLFKKIESKETLPLFVLNKADLSFEEWEPILAQVTPFTSKKATYHVLLAPDQGKSDLRYKEIKFLSLDQSK